MLDGSGTAPACDSASDCLGDQGCETWPGETGKTCTYVETDPAPGLPELDLSLPDGTVEIFVCDSLGNCSAVSSYAYRSYDGIAASGSVSIGLVEGGYLNSLSEIVCSGDQIGSNPAQCADVETQLTAGQIVKLQEVPVSVEGRLPGTLVEIFVDDQKADEHLLVDGDFTNGVALVPFYIAIADGNRRIEVNVTDPNVADDTCAPPLPGLVNVIVDTSRIELNSDLGSALNTLGAQFTTSTVACVGPFQDLNLDLSDGNINTQVIGEGTFKMVSTFLWLYSSLQLILANCSMPLLQNKSHRVQVMPIVVVRKCVVNQCWASKAITAESLVQSDQFRIPAGQSGRSETLNYIMRDSAGNISSALQDPIVAYSYTISKVFDAVPGITLSVPGTLGADSAGTAAVSIVKGTEWDTIGNEAKVQIFKMQRRPKQPMSSLLMVPRSTWALETQGYSEQSSPQLVRPL